MTTKTITINGNATEVTLERDGNSVRSGGHEIEIVAARRHELEIRFDGRTHIVPFVIDDWRLSFAFDGEIYSAEVTDAAARTRARHRDHSMAAPMPGLVLKLLVEPGSEVAKGAPLIILEAMKMEHQIVAPYAGTVRAVNCKEGDLVQPGVELIDIDKEDQPEQASGGS